MRALLSGLVLLSVGAFASIKMDMELVHKQGFGKEEYFLKNEFFQSKKLKNEDHTKLSISNLKVEIDTTYRNEIGDIGPVPVVDVVTKVLRVEEGDTQVLNETIKTLKMGVKEKLSIENDEIGKLDIYLTPKN